MQTLKGLEQLNAGQWKDLHCKQLIQGRRLTDNGQPEEHTLLQWREPIKLLIQQVADVAKDNSISSQKRTHISTEDVENHLHHDLQGQRIPPIDLGEPLYICPCPKYFFLHEKLLASRTIQSCE